jgi:hypothetical protein
MRSTTLRTKVVNKLWVFVKQVKEDLKHIHKTSIGFIIIELLKGI